MLEFKDQILWGRLANKHVLHVLAATPISTFQILRSKERK